LRWEFGGDELSDGCGIERTTTREVEGAICAPRPREHVRIEFKLESWREICERTRSFRDREDLSLLKQMGTNPLANIGVDTERDTLRVQHLREILI
jgi:hypothetical protein